MLSSVSVGIGDDGRDECADVLAVVLGPGRDEIARDALRDEKARPTRRGARPRIAGVRRGRAPRSRAPWTSWLAVSAAPSAARSIRSHCCGRTWRFFFTDLSVVSAIVFGRLSSRTVSGKPSLAARIMPEFDAVWSRTEEGLRAESTQEMAAGGKPAWSRRAIGASPDGGMQGNARVLPEHTVAPIGGGAVKALMLWRVYPV